MTTDKRKEQLRKGAKEYRKRLKEKGYIRAIYWIKPEWGMEIRKLIERLKGEK